MQGLPALLGAEVLEMTATLLGLALVAWSGMVIGVADGDTITVLRGKEPVRIRLHGIDCPEKRQPYGMAAKKLTSRLVMGKLVRVSEVARDRYGRTVGKIMIGGQSLEKELLRAGLAWWYRKYARKEKVLAALESMARKAKLGLWKDREPLPPWDWRRRKKARK